MVLLSGQILCQGDATSAGTCALHLHSACRYIPLKLSVLSSACPAVLLVRLDQPHCFSLYSPAAAADLLYF